MLNWHAAVGLAAGIIQVLSVVPYVRGMLRGTTRPNIVSWSLWAVLQSIAIFAQLSAGASWSVLLLIAMTFNTYLVVILAAVGYGYKSYGWLDGACLASSLAAIILWKITNDPVTALYLAVVADLIAALPTLIKTIKDPFSEIPLAWFMVTVAAALSIVSTTKFDAANLIFPAYLVVGTGFMGSVAYFGQRLKGVSPPTSVQ